MTVGAGDKARIVGGTGHGPGRLEIRTGKLSFHLALHKTLNTEWLGSEEQSWGLQDGDEADPNLNRMMQKTAKSGCALVTDNGGAMWSCAQGIAFLVGL